MSPRVLLTKARALRKTTLFSFLRFQSQDVTKLNSSLRAEELKNKGLLRVSGPEVKTFLQGLITNDLDHLDNGRSSIYSAFLNIKGRILHDTIIYKTKEENVFLIECDVSGVSELERHLKIFKVRKKIDINDVSNEIKVWVVFNRNYPFESNSPESMNKDEFNFDGYLHKSMDQEHSAVYKDPRLLALGARVLVQSSSKFTTTLEKIKIKYSSDFSYRTLRFRLGIGEGASELPPGKCFPHEANCDFLHGISFHKGCYIGQEVTSRTQHTGVVRKRLMPIKFSESETGKCNFDTPVTDPEKDTVVGKVRGVEQNYGLALLRISEALEANILKVSNIPVSTFRPHWWPIEVPKEKFTVV